jgi:FtsP/CotA-like multicopper oxidase with cupredoxin domain
MSNTRCWLALGLISLCAAPAMAQSFRVQCPLSTITHPDSTATTTQSDLNSQEPQYLGPTALVWSDTHTATQATPEKGYLVPSAQVNPSSQAAGQPNGAIKCQQISGGDGYATMADGHQTFMFSFGPLSGLASIAYGNPDGAFDRGTGASFPNLFNTVYSGTLVPGDPATTDGASDSGTSYNPGSAPDPRTATTGFLYDGAIGLAFDSDCLAANNAAPAGSAKPCPNTPITGKYLGLDGHVDPRQIEDVGVMNGNIPAPLITMDEDDEFFLTLTNVGMIMRPDLFEQHTVHFHGYPNASSFYDGVPDASVAINIGGSFTYYYLAPDAGTYFWHCHITPPEHLQMGMVGQLYVRPRQNRVPATTNLYTARKSQDVDQRTACVSVNDILCSHNLPLTNGTVVATGNGVARAATGNYAYNDGDGSTYYDVEYPIQIHGFDPNFHFVGMTFNPEAFADMKDKYFLLNGRSYPDTGTQAPLATQSSDTKVHYSQPLATVINIPQGKRALLRISDLDVSEYQTLASLGIRMQVVGYNAKLLRDQAGNNTAYYTNSITLGGGESLDAILDTCLVRTNAADPSSACAAGGAIPKGVYFLYTPNLDHLSNDAENFGGLMAEVHVN